MVNTHTKRMCLCVCARVFVYTDILLGLSSKNSLNRRRQQMFHNSTGAQAQTRTHLEKGPPMHRSLQNHEQQSAASQPDCAQTFLTFARDNLLYLNSVLCFVNPDLNIYSTNLGGGVSGQEINTFVLELPGILRSFFFC